VEGDIETDRLAPDELGEVVVTVGLVRSPPELTLNE